MSGRQCNEDEQLEALTREGRAAAEREIVAGNLGTPLDEVIDSLDAEGDDTDDPDIDDLTRDES